MCEQLLRSFEFIQLLRHSSVFLIFSYLSGTFITQPSVSPSGLTVTMKMKYDHTSLNTSDEKFIFDTGGWLGHGVSLFVQNEVLYAVVGSNGKVWVVSCLSVYYKG